MIYKFGGTESFTAKFVEILQSLYSSEKITLITECFKKGDELSDEKFSERLNNAYGTSINPEKLNAFYIHTSEPKLSSGILLPFSRIKRKITTNHIQNSLLKETEKYDLFVNCSNQSFRGNAKNNITIIHFPQNPSSQTGINRKIPFLRYFAKKEDEKYKNCYRYFLPNSQFTAYWLKQKWNLQDEKIRVFYHPVAPVETHQDKIPGQICACGRIEESKKIDVMIKAFNSSDFLRQNCTLKIAGSCDNEDLSYINYIKSLLTDKVKIIFSPSRKELEELYASSQIFWHAKGYGETNPMLMEHFGMTTVEAMSAGCVPVVINKGGQKEIVTENCGYTWNEPEELVKHTEELLKSPEKIKMMSRNCVERSKMCSKEKFKEEIKGLISNLFENTAETQQ